MARKPKGYDTGFQIDVEDFEKALQRTQKKFDDKADALLMAQGRVVTNKVKSKTPLGKRKKLRASWRLKKVKQYGKTKAVRIQSSEPYAHLVELGHAIISGGKSRVGRRTLNTVERKVRGIKTLGRVEGKKMLENTMQAAQSNYYSNIHKYLNEVIEEVEL